MPIEFGLWRLDNGAVEAVPPAQLQDESQLEDVIEQRVDILGLGQLLILGRQVVTDYGKKIDLLAMDGQGDLYVIELKRDRTPRDVVAQALEYGWWVERLSWERIGAIYAKHHDEADLATAFNEHFDADAPETVNSSHHLLVVASRWDSSTEQIVEYVRGYGVPVNVLFFEYLEDGERRYLARSWLKGPEEEGLTSATSKKQPPWNGVDFFVAVGEGEHGHRNWDDMRRYGFVAAGHGDKYRKAMSNLSEGARVWACIPGTGYVGVGEVTDTAVGVNDFIVEREDGHQFPLLSVSDLAAPNMAEDADDPENAEYLVRVRWLDTRPREQAIWEKGMFANQNVVAKLRQPFTLQRLTELFDVETTNGGHGAQASAAVRSAG
jgi:hypothetical protein